MLRYTLEVVLFPTVSKKSAIGAIGEVTELVKVIA